VIPYGRQEVTPEDVEAVLEALGSDFLTQGPKPPAFEAAVAERVQAPQAVAVSSATAALHVACRALGLGPGDRLWTSPITFVASANCALYCGAEVDFVDVDPDSWLMCPDRLEAKLVEAERAGRLPKIVVPVHLCGQSCDMAAIGALAARFGFHVVEDASHAVGGAFRGRPVGACAHSDAAVFSFHPVKIITSGEGGMALCRDAALAERMRRLRSHGITRDPEVMTHAPDGPWYYQQVELGWNYRMTDLQAALGLSQLRRLDAYVARRNALARRYDAALAGLPLRTQAPTPDALSAFHLYVVRLTEPGRRRAVFEGLRGRGIGVNVHYIPVHLQPHYRALGFAEADFPEAERYYAGAISLPLFPTLDEARQDRVVEALRAELAA
jgi:UDP-4-amino-4,6-dideoxy-N-acetyl-beta-L-altrosamine transaminase